MVLLKFMIHTGALLDERLEMLLDQIKVGGRDPIKSQQAVALSVAKLVVKCRITLRRNNRTIISMRAGMGKFVVIGLIAAPLEKDFDKITLVYTEKDLIKFEKDMIAQLKNLLFVKNRFAAVLMDSMTNEHQLFPVLKVTAKHLIIFE